MLGTMEEYLCHRQIQVTIENVRKLCIDSDTSSHDVYCILACDGHKIKSKLYPSNSHAWNFSAQLPVKSSHSILYLSFWRRDSQGLLKEECIGLLKLKLRSLPFGQKVTSWFLMQLPEQRIQVSGETCLSLVLKLSDMASISIDDFTIISVIGQGSFGKVLLVSRKTDGQVFALKVLRKADLVEREEVAHTKAERDVLVNVTSPFIVPLRYSFQSRDKIYFVMDYYSGGELFYHMQRERTFSEERAKFYAAELCLALEYLHANHIVYRDMKPENILMDSDGHLAVADLGLCKIHVTGDACAKTFCGTAEYLAPEIIQGKLYGKAVDWWSLGTIIYEMVTGLPPFYSDNTNLMYRRIVYEKLTFPTHVPPTTKDFISKLLEKNPNNRLGNGVDGTRNVLSHPYFESIDWNILRKKEATPPFRPRIQSIFDTQNFDPEFTSQESEEGCQENVFLSPSTQLQFDGFSFCSDF